MSIHFLACGLELNQQFAALSSGFLTYSPALMAWGFQAQAAIALEERLTSPNLREDAPSR